MTSALISAWGRQLTRCGEELPGLVMIAWSGSLRPARRHGAVASSRLVLTQWAYVRRLRVVVVEEWLNVSAESIGKDKAAGEPPS
jgi:hypothetical protein